MTIKEPIEYATKKTIDLKRGIYNNIKFTYFKDDKNYNILHNHLYWYTDFSEYLDTYINNKICSENIYADMINVFQHSTNDELSYKYGYKINDINRRIEFSLLIEKYEKYSKKLIDNLIWGGILEIPEKKFCEWVYYIKSENKICDINGYELIFDGGNENEM